MPKHDGKKAPKGSHVMPDGSVMKDSDMDDKPMKKTTAKAKPPPKAKGTRKPSSWNQHVSKVYQAGKKKNGDYKYSQAMKDAKKTYKPATK